MKYILNMCIKIYYFYIDKFIFIFINNCLKNLWNIFLIGLYIDKYNNAQFTVYKIHK